MSITLEKSEIQRIAATLQQAEKTQQQAELISGAHPDLSFEDAYEIQDAWVNMKLADGSKAVGHKIGLTSTVMQRAFGIGEPDFGVLLGEMMYENNASIPTTSLIEPRIEAELAFMFKEDLPAGKLSIEDVLSRVEYIIPALELIDFRVKVTDGKGKNRTVKDTISDNAANCAVVKGEKKIPLDADLPWLAAVLRKNGVIEATGVAGAVLDHPVNSIIWLNEKYAEFGRTIKAGELVLAGSFIAPIPVSKGDVIEVDYNEFGKLKCVFG